MNKIFIGDKKVNKDLYLNENTIIIIKDSHNNINIFSKEKINVFILMISSSLEITCKVENSSSLNIFSVNSTLKVNIDLLKDNINYKYAYSTINSLDNNYEVNINHIGSDINSKITNHGINTENNKLDFVINTIVPKKAVRINTNQDSKIIVLKDNNASIKPNLLIDNDDIEANHSAYIGRFKEDDLFYFMTRGINKKDAVKLMIKAFLTGNMNIDYEERNLVLDTINQYWR